MDLVHIGKNGVYLKSQKVSVLVILFNSAFWSTFEQNWQKSQKIDFFVHLENCIAKAVNADLKKCTGGRGDKVHENGNSRKIFQGTLILV